MVDVDQNGSVVESFTIKAQGVALRLNVSLKKISVDDRGIVSYYSIPKGELPAWIVIEAPSEICCGCTAIAKIKISPNHNISAGSYPFGIEIIGTPIQIGNIDVGFLPGVFVPLIVNVGDVNAQLVFKINKPKIPIVVGKPIFFVVDIKNLGMKTVKIAGTVSVKSGKDTYNGVLLPRTILGGGSITLPISWQPPGFGYYKLEILWDDGVSDRTSINFLYIGWLELCLSVFVLFLVILEIILWNRKKVKK